MKYYGLDSDGEIKIPHVSSLPTYNYTQHEGKIYYSETEDKFYIGHGNPTGSWVDIFIDPISASRTISFHHQIEDTGDSVVKYAYYDENELFLADWVLKIPHVSSLPVYDHTIHKGQLYYLTTTNTVYIGIGTTTIGGWLKISSNGLNWQTTSSNTTAKSANGYLVNSTFGNVTVTLPSSPIEGDIVGVCDSYNKSTINTITIARNGSNIEGAADDLVIDVNGAGFTLVYVDTTRGWKTINSFGSVFANIVEDTSPQLGGMLDVNSNAIGDGTLELLKFSETGSAVNEITVKNAATGSGPEIQATGDDTNIDLNLIPKGTGGIQLADALLKRPKIEDYSESHNAIAGTQTSSFNVDLENGNIQSVTFGAGTYAVTFTNPPVSDAGSITLICTNAGLPTITWTNVVWADGESPDELTNSGIDILTFMTINAGSTWYGFSSGLDMS